MKKLLIIPLLFACFMSIGQTESSAFIIGKPIRIGNLLVAQNDFPNDMNWDDARKACDALGSGWRLPNKEELNILYQNKDKIGGFASVNYWSGQVNDNYYDHSWGQGFYNGVQYFDRQTQGYHVRAVRSL